MLAWLRQLISHLILLPALDWGAIKKMEQEMLQREREGQVQIIEAQYQTISNLKSEVTFLRENQKELQNLLALATHIKVESGHERVEKHYEPVGSNRSWPRLKKELERQHSKSNEDKVKEYWAGKNAEMENAAGIGQLQEEEKDASDIREAI